MAELVGATHAPAPRGRKVEWLGLGVGSAITLLIVAPASWADRGIWISTLPLTIGVALMIVGASLRARHLHVPPLMLLFTLVIASGFLGAIFTGLLDQSMAFGLMYLVVLWFFAGNLADERRTATRMIIGAGLLVAAICVAEVIHGAPLIAEVPFRGTNPFLGSIRAQATLPHPLVAGFVQLAALLMVLISDAKRARKWAAILLLLGGILATGSSSALALALGSVIFTVIWPRSGATRLIGLVVVVVVAFLGIATDTRFTELTDDLSVNSNTHRLNSLLAVPRLLFERPFVESIFGSGWSSVHELYNHRYFDNDGFFAVDNMFVSMLAFGGIIGILAYLAFIVVVLVRCADPKLRMPFTVLVAMGLSFDTLLWPIAGALLVYLGTWAMDQAPDRADDRPTSIKYVLAPGSSGTAYAVRAPNGW